MLQRAGMMMMIAFRHFALAEEERKAAAMPSQDKQPPAIKMRLKMI